MGLSYSGRKHTFHCLPAASSPLNPPLHILAVESPCSTPPTHAPSLSVWFIFMLLSLMFIRSSLLFIICPLRYIYECSRCQCIINLPLTAYNLFSYLYYLSASHILHLHRFFLPTLTPVPSFALTSSQLPTCLLLDVSALPVLLSCRHHEDQSSVNYMLISRAY